MQGINLSAVSSTAGGRWHRSGKQVGGAGRNPMLFSLYGGPLADDGGALRENGGPPSVSRPAQTPRHNLKWQHWQAGSGQLNYSDVPALLLARPGGPAEGGLWPR